MSWTDDYEKRMKRALLGATSVTGDGAAKVTSSGRGLEDWLGFFAQNGAYNSGGQELLAYQRNWRIYVELAETDAARKHPQYCPFEDWSRDAADATVRELYTVGFAAMASGQKDPEDPADESIIPPIENYLSSTALADRAADFDEALSATRDFYVNGFAGSRDDPLRLAWETTPFLRRPLMRLPNGPLVLISPRAIRSWLTDGTHYRLLDAAIDRGQRGDFTAFVGWLFETYVHEVFTAGLGERDPGEGRVHGDYEYAGMRTSDVALDFGEDLVLGEVISTRLPLGVRAEADKTELGTYLERTITRKLGQLDRVVNDVRDERAYIPGVEMAGVRRVWPLLIGVGEVVESEALWSYIHRKKAGLLEQEVCEKLTLLGVEEVEVLAGMVAAREDLVGLLHEKQASGYGELSWIRWINDIREEPPPRLPALVGRWEALMSEAVALLGIHSHGQHK